MVTCDKQTALHFNKMTVSIVISLLAPVLQVVISIHKRTVHVVSVVPPMRKHRGGQRARWKYKAK